ncbi:MAG: sigma-54 dependent transcriptional regulator, partial [bacterium]
LIVDDEQNVHYSFKKLFAKEYDILSALRGDDALSLVQEDPPDLVIMDVRMPGLDGLQVLQEIKARTPDLPVIIMTAYGGMRTAIEAMKQGAYEYVLKPFDIPHMRAVMAKALRAGEMPKKAQTAPLLEVEEDLIVGISPAMQDVFKLIGQVAGQDVTVLLRGQSGTGKELVARAIVQHSRRAEAPFITVNCAAIPDTLLESELFGYERGAFTGATERRIGTFEQADGGTIFLDEIGDMSIATQAKILRVIQEGEFTRLGRQTSTRVDVRLIAATHIDLEKALVEKRFREDLYYRLNVVNIHLPPLKERTEDISLLVKYFLRRFSRELGRLEPTVAPAALKTLRTYTWPGNVRELENVIKRALILSKGDLIAPDDIQLSSERGSRAHYEEHAQIEALLEQLTERAFAVGEQGDLLADLERLLLLKALRRTGGNQAEAAHLLGMNRNTLRNRMATYNIAKETRISSDVTDNI